MTTVNKLLCSAEVICKQVGYAKVIQALTFRHAIHIHATESCSWSTAAQLANLPTRRLNMMDEVELEKQIRHYAGDAT
jgi:hypothetical protein